MSHCLELYRPPISNQSLAKSLAKRTGFLNWLYEVCGHMENSEKGERSGLGVGGDVTVVGRGRGLVLRTSNRQSTCLPRFPLHCAFSLATIFSQEGKELGEEFAHFTCKTQIYIQYMAIYSISMVLNFHWGRVTTEKLSKKGSLGKKGSNEKKLRKTDLYQCVYPEPKAP